jgi:hypothetical protein
MAMKAKHRRSRNDNPAYIDVITYTDPESVPIPAFADELGISVRGARDTIERYGLTLGRAMRYKKHGKVLTAGYLVVIKDDRFQRFLKVRKDNLEMRKTKDEVINVEI